ncbi:hypothetical protein [Pseudomonas sp. 24 E 13]|uniref:hypothetical protein n=1 Tax=Pseudomonas sp. 24 E 13 TaxID=1844095 RepID=UPI001146C578|nr:hypothetical protein [Pseudomonas sp. 24 E 13]
MKPVHGLITKERLIVFAVALVFYSPENFEIFDLLTKGPSISELTEKLNSSLKLLPAIPIFFTTAIVFFFSAKAYQLLAKVTNSFTLKKLGTIIAKLQELEKSNDLFFTDRILEITFDWKLEKNSAEKRVKRLANLSETFISMSIICLYLTIVHDKSMTAACLLCVIATLYSIESSRKILMIYLTDIATYKIASTRLSKISSVYDSKATAK